MLIPDPIAPYVGLIRVALWCLLAGGLFVTGCNHGEDNQAAKSQKAVAKAEQQRDEALAAAAENLRAANACGLLLEDLNRHTQAAIDEASRQKAEAIAAAGRAESAAAESQRRAGVAEKALQAAKSQPLCRSQLEMSLCDSIPLL